MQPQRHIPASACVEELTPKEGQCGGHKRGEDNINGAHDETGDDLVTCEAPLPTGRFYHVKHWHTVHLHAFNQSSECTLFMPHMSSLCRDG